MSKKFKGTAQLGVNYQDQSIPGHRHVFTMECIDGFLSNLKGEILTIIDASVADPRQLKAVKDLIHNRFSGTRWDIINVAASEMPDVYGDYGMLTASPVEIITQEQLS